MSNIIMGNDEFILYIRKQHTECRTSNKTLGKRIWERIQLLDPTHDGPIERDLPCQWGTEGVFIDETLGLPQTAAQFEFDRAILPALYDYLDELGQQGSV